MVWLLIDLGDVIWIEDLCYWGVCSVLNVLGLIMWLILVDDEGIVLLVVDFVELLKLMFVMLLY